MDNPNALYGIVYSRFGICICEFSKHDAPLIRTRPKDHPLWCEKIFWHHSEIEFLEMEDSFLNGFEPPSDRELISGVIAIPKPHIESEEAPEVLIEKYPDGSLKVYSLNGKPMNIAFIEFGEDDLSNMDILPTHGVFTGMDEITINLLRTPDGKDDTIQRGDATQDPEQGTD